MSNDEDFEHILCGVMAFCFMKHIPFNNKITDFLNLFYNFYKLLG